MTIVRPPAPVLSPVDGGPLLVVALDTGGAEAALRHAAEQGCDRPVTVLGPLRVSWWWLLAYSTVVPAGTLAAHELVRASQESLVALARGMDLEATRAVCAVGPLEQALADLLRARDYAAVIVGCGSRRARRRRRALGLERLAGAWCPARVVEP